MPLDDAPRTSLTPGLLSQGWHLVAPVQVLGWMVAHDVLDDTRGTARDLGVNHLGLRAGFRSANRARYFAKLCRQHRDLATLTLQRNIIWALADLGVIPEAATDAGRASSDDAGRTTPGYGLLRANQRRPLAPLVSQGSPLESGTFFP
jgi:hypothetical protein